MGMSDSWTWNLKQQGTRAVLQLWENQYLVLEMSYGGFSSSPFAGFVDFRCQHEARKRGFGEISKCHHKRSKDHQDRDENFLDEILFTDSSRLIVLKP